MDRILGKPFAARLKSRMLKVFYSLLSPPTIAVGWERYAKMHGERKDRYLGDEWNVPEIMGIDAPAHEIVSYLDTKVFRPFLGECDVLLEIGAGGGRFTEILLPKAKKLIAADTSPTMLKLLRKRFPEETKIEYLLLDGKGLSPIPDRSVHGAFSYGVFVHLQHWDIYNYLCELKRVLKPGGKAIIQHGNTFSKLGWRQFLAELPSSLNRPKLPTAFALFTPEIMKEFVQRAGPRLENCLTQIARRDAISLILSP